MCYSMLRFSFIKRLQAKVGTGCNPVKKLLEFVTLLLTATKILVVPSHK